MFKNITIGQYVEGNSFIHKMDARVKILLALFYIFILFIIASPAAYVVFTIFTVFLIMISGRVYSARLKTHAFHTCFHGGNKSFYDGRRNRYLDVPFLEQNADNRRGVKNSGNDDIAACLPCCRNIGSYAYYVAAYAYGRHRKSFETF